MAKRFKSNETCDKAVSALAENINDLFRNGIDEERYQEMIQDETNASCCIN